MIILFTIIGIVVIGLALFGIFSKEKNCKSLKFDKNMKKENLILLIGSILVALRLMFPVLQCQYEIDRYDKDRCMHGQVAFFSFHPISNYSYHETRTNTQAVAVGVLTIAMYFIFKQKNKTDNHQENTKK